MIILLDLQRFIINIHLTDLNGNSIVDTVLKIVALTNTSK